MRYVNEPTPGSLADMQDDADPESVARTILLRRLTACSRTRKECLDDLVKRGIPLDVATQAVDRFVEVGLIDDAEYARLWAQSRHRTKGSARSVLRQELRAKGVDDALTTEALDEIDPAAEQQRARQLVEVRMRSMSRLDMPTRQRRLVSMLLRRGYPHSMAVGIVRDVLGEQPDIAPESL